MNAESHIQQASLSVLLSLSDVEPSNSVQLSGSVSQMAVLLGQSFKPGILPMLAERSQHFLKFSLDVDALSEQLDELTEAYQSQQDVKRLKDIRFRLMVADAPFPMMSSLLQMTQSAFTQWRKDNELSTTNAVGGKLKKLSEAEDSTLNKVMVALNKSQRRWLAGEMFLQAHSMTGISVRHIWRYACEKGVV